MNLYNQVFSHRAIAKPVLHIYTCISTYYVSMLIEQNNWLRFNQHSCIEFAELQSCYIDIVTSMPQNYLETVQLLESHLCNQHISDIFECSSALDANQTVVKCLIEKATCKPDVLDFCETLLHLKNASQLVCTVEKLRKSKCIVT